MAHAPTKPATKQQTRVDRYGRVVIPVEIREQLGLKAGEPVSIWVENGELRIMTVREGIRKAQQIAAKYIQGRTGLVDEFIADRRRDSGD